MRKVVVVWLMVIWRMDFLWFAGMRNTTKIFFFFFSFYEMDWLALIPNVVNQDKILNVKDS